MDPVRPRVPSTGKDRRQQSSEKTSTIHVDEPESQVRASEWRRNWLPSWTRLGKSQRQLSRSRKRPCKLDPNAAFPVRDLEFVYQKYVAFADLMLILIPRTLAETTDKLKSFPSLTNRMNNREISDANRVTSSRNL